MSFNTKKIFFRPNVLKKFFYDFFVFFFVVSPDFFVLKDLFPSNVQLEICLSHVLYVKDKTSLEPYPEPLNKTQDFIT
jgi:hypothetical protein